MSADMFTDPHMDELATIIGFGPDDLAANHQRKLSPAQIRRLRLDYRRQYWPSLIAWSILGALVGSLAAMSLSISPAWMLLFLAVTLGSGMAAVEARGARQAVQATEKAVRRATFRADDDWRPRVRISMIEFAIGGQWVAMHRDVLTALKKGQRYHIYYAPDVLSFPVGGTARRQVQPAQHAFVGSHRVLSIEPEGYTLKATRPGRIPEDLSPEEQLAWLDSLARRQGDE